MKACKTCLRLYEEADRCPDCSTTTSQYWSGYMAIINPDASQIAKKMEIKTPGQYAIKVR